MNADARIARWLDDGLRFLDEAAALVDRGRQAYDEDLVLRLALEALGTRVGEVCKRLTTPDPHRFREAPWSGAARFRDFVTHHYDRIDYEAMWQVVSVSFPELATAMRITRDTLQ